MKKLRFAFALLLCVLCFTACGDDAPPAVQPGTNQLQLTVEERKDIFASYFNHSLASKTGRYIGQTSHGSYEMECADGSIFAYSLCREENLGFYYPMTGSLDYALSLEEGREIIVFYIRGEDGINHAKTVAPTILPPGYIRVGAQPADSPQTYYKEMQKTIRANLDSTENPQVLTLDEALAVFWAQSGLQPSDFLQKTGAHGDVFYQHKTDSHSVMATVNLRCTQPPDGEGLANAHNSAEYAFVVMQSSGENYIINIDGTVTKTDKIHGIYK